LILNTISSPLLKLFLKSLDSPTFQYFHIGDTTGEQNLQTIHQYKAGSASILQQHKKYPCDEWCCHGQEVPTLTPPSSVCGFAVCGLRAGFRLRYSYSSSTEALTPLHLPYATLRRSSTSVRVRNRSLDGRFILILSYKCRPHSSSKRSP
jgi:hypothetical protein